MTFELARLVGPGGFVTVVDMDEVKLGLARKAAVQRGVSNVEFAARNVSNWDEPDAYDVVYSRFLRQHLSEPVDLLRRVWAAVRSGGLVIVEDAPGGMCGKLEDIGIDRDPMAGGRATATTPVGAHSMPDISGVSMRWMPVRDRRFPAAAHPAGRLGQHAGPAGSR